MSTQLSKYIHGLTFYTLNGVHIKEMKEKELLSGCALSSAKEKEARYKEKQENKGIQYFGLFGSNIVKINLGRNRANWSLLCK